MPGIRGSSDSIFLCCFGRQKYKKTALLEVPTIVVTCPEDPEKAGDNIHPQSKEIEQLKAERRKKLDKQDELSKAHQEVIDQMRNAMKEARGGNNTHTNTSIDSVLREEIPERAGRRPLSCVSAGGEKPQVPPTKAAAVAKIRAAIAKSKLEAGQDLGSTNSSDVLTSDFLSEEAQPDSKKSVQTQPRADNETKSQTVADNVAQTRPIADNVAQNPPIADTVVKTQPIAGNEVQIQPMAGSMAQIQPLAGSGGQTQPIGNNLVREAAIGKLKAAILAAAVNKLDSDLTSSTETPARCSKSHSVRSRTDTDRPTDGLRAGANTGITRRRSEGDQVKCSETEKHKPLIWDFFEEGKKSSSCRTCGYSVSKRTNNGGLVRHLSLVHQREYRQYTMRMEKNWTHGMLEKNLNIRLPKNF